MVAIDTYQSSLSLILQSGEFMSIDPSIKKNVVNLINKERNINIHSLTYQPNLTIQDSTKESKEILDEIRKELNLSIKNKQSITCILVRH